MCVHAPQHVHALALRIVVSARISHCDSNKVDLRSIRQEFFGQRWDVPECAKQMKGKT
jgi:hypothetical protein